jgi:hypothetical protein
MALILKVVAAVLTAIGAATLYWGTSPSLLSLGNTVMIVGAVIGSGGIVLFGLAAVLGQLQVLGAKLDGLQGVAAGPADVRAPARPAAVAEPVHAEPLHVEAPHAGVHAPVAAPLVEPDLRSSPEPVLAPPPVQATEPAAPVPPTRRSFGLPPLATRGSVAASADVAGLAAGTLAAAAAPSLAGEKVAERSQPADPAPAIEPPMVAPVMPAMVAPEAGRDKDVEAEKDLERAEETFGDIKDAPPEDFKAAQASPELDHAVEEMKDEVRAAEADLTVPRGEAGDDKDGGDVPVDHLASLERLLLGASAGDARAPAEPEPLEVEHVRSEVREPTFTEVEPLQPEPAEPEVVKTATSEPLASPAGLDTDDFMARLRETISRPVAPPTPPEAMLDPPKAAFRSEPPAAEPPPALSIEEELERALKASLEAPEPEPAKPVYVEPPKPAEAAPFLRSVPPEPPTTPAVDREPEKRDDPMAVLARDFPELNDILSPKKPAANPAGSLIDDLKDIFEPSAKPAARQEPSFAGPGFAEPSPPAPPKPPLLREGVIATIPFRLYGDGTIEADLEEGTTQFASLKDFRAHVGG